MSKKNKQKKIKITKKKARSSGKNGYFKKWFWFVLFVLVIIFIAYIFYLNYQIQSRFSASRWFLPAKVYAANLVLTPGLKLSLKQLEQELKFSSYRKDKKASTQGSYSQHGNSLLISVRGFYLASGVYQKSQLVRVSFTAKKISSINQQKNSRRLAKFILDPALISNFGIKTTEDRHLVSQKQVPELLVKAIIATEDQHFYWHPGVDPIGIFRAFYYNFRAGRTVQGGSTVTQQLVKNYFLSSEKSLQRKINEALMALILEYHYSKKEIMTAYINQVYLGQDKQRAIHGFALASEYFFRRSIKQISLPQIATLVGLVKGASYYNPRKHPKRAAKRRNLVLKLMFNEGYISNKQYLRASKATLGIRHFVSHSRSRFPAFTQAVKNELLEHFSISELQQNGLRIFTTLKPWVQRKAQKDLKKAVAVLQRKQGKKPVLQAAMIISETNNSNIVALIGGKKSSNFNFNRAIDIKRTIGSLVKPAIYLTAFKQGYQNHSIIDDSPIKVKLSDKNYWYPRNFSHKSHGKVSLNTALSHSYNIASVRLGLTIGLDKVLQTLRLLGVKQQLPIYPSVLLGALSMSPYAVNQFYQTIANQGIYLDLTSISGVLDKDNKKIKLVLQEKSLRFSKTVIKMLTNSLKQVVQQGTAKSIKKLLPGVLNLSAKTGTSNKNRDSWFVAYNDQYVATVWLGNDQNLPIKYTGSTGALQVWANVMKDLL
ncbi:MAG: penicillin-binding protein 1B [Pseudomonadota bacterium]